MATKRIKRRTRRRSCKNGKLKRPVRTKKGGRRRCKKSKSRRKRKSYKMRSLASLSAGATTNSNLSINQINALIASGQISRQVGNEIIQYRTNKLRTFLAQQGQQERINEFVKYVEKGKLELVKIILLDYLPMIDINGRNDNNKTALIVASDKGDRQMVRILLANGAQPGVSIPPPLFSRELDIGKPSALVTAVKRHHTEIVEMLLRAGANENDIIYTDPHAPAGFEEKNMTVLEYSETRGYDDIVELLYEYGAELLYEYGAE